MGKVTEFLLRWFFLANLIDDRIDIQNIAPAIQHNDPNLGYNSNQMNQHDMLNYMTKDGPTPNLDATSTDAINRKEKSARDIENEWKIKCYRGLTMYPPGSHRRLAIDSLRLEIVRNLASHLSQADQLLKQPAAYQQKQSVARKTDIPMNHHNATEILLDLTDTTNVTEGSKKTHNSHLIDSLEDEYDQILDDSLLDADLEILEALRQATTISQMRMQTPMPQHETASNINQKPNDQDQKEQKAAQSLLREEREYLPQLVSVVLHSRGALTAQPSLDPIKAMRKLLINRCLQDPSLGIELCWLLEAEVGRAWKSLFEHRQQTGRRLIVVLPAEKARVIAKIGTEKKAAFDLLQDAEQTTAYGCSTYSKSGGHHIYNHPYGSEYMDETQPDPPSQLPAALSLKRCSHFGDTMHFIDSLTQISMDLRILPNMERNAHLHKRLYELNRRLRRRMVTKGAVSLDVDDSLSEADWPHVSDVTLDMLRYSVHFPLEPKSVVWEGGDNYQTPIKTSPSTSYKIPFVASSLKTKPNGKTGVMRVLNIVVSESRLLASRERCPFLIQVEVAETGLEGSDARLYAGGGVNVGKPNPSISNRLQTEAGFGVSLEEFIHLFASSKQHQNQESMTQGQEQNQYVSQQYDRENFPSYHIPAELLAQDINILSKSSDDDEETEDKPTTTATTTTTVSPSAASNKASHLSEKASTPDVDFPRGGEQYPYEDSTYYPNPYVLPPNTYNPEIMQQHEAHGNPISGDTYQQQNQSGQSFYTQDKGLEHLQQPPTQETQELQSSDNLLDTIFGTSWSKKCQQIRQSSPYGKVRGWRLASFIMKAGEDIRKEALVMQVISKLRDWFEKDLPESSRPYLRPYTIMCVGGDAGLLECLPDVKSVDEVKKRTEGFTTLRDYFERAYGPPKPVDPPIKHPSSSYAVSDMTGMNSGTFSPPPNVHVHQGPSFQGPPPYPSQNSNTQHILQPPPPPPPPPPNSPSFTANISESSHDNITFEEARDNFMRSLVGYSLVCYILQIKDRHNANILMDRKGHLLHIDFGFVLGETPKMGKVPLFSERAPFKLTTDFWDVIGGWNINEGGQGVRFCKMFEVAFECASSHAEEIASLVEAAVLNLTSNSARARQLANGVRMRLRMRGAKDSAEQKIFIMELVNSALTSWGTSTYDWLQKSMNGYQ